MIGCGRSLSQLEQALTEQRATIDDLNKVRGCVGLPPPWRYLWLRAAMYASFAGQGSEYAGLEAAVGGNQAAPTRERNSWGAGGPHEEGSTQDGECSMIKLIAAAGV
jgi:hypothetical protein